ncbi:hypothetical protein G3573_10210 [Caulobacter sp. 17J65-9]|nr:hypothetical protein [Caulobacter sp. 17J65-9]
MIATWAALITALLASAAAPAPQGGRLEYEGPPSPEAASAKADRLIEAAGAQGVFVNASTGPTTVVLHGRSGLRCYDATQITVFDSGSERGDGVACDFVNGDERTTLLVYYTPHRARRPPADDIGLHGLSGPFAVYEGPNSEHDPSRPRAWAKAPAHPAERRTAVRDGAAVFTRLSIGRAGEWTVLERTTGPLALAKAVDYHGDALMIGALLELAERQ